jgi:ribosomal protein S18 acetylase RimI-like enzyme
MRVRAALLRRQGTTRDGRELLLRPTRETDAPNLVALLDAVAAEREFIAAVPGERSVAEEQLALAVLLGEGGLSIVVEVEANIAGHLVVHRGVAPDEAHSGDVAIIVANQYRGTGVGRLLMVTAIDWGRAVGLGRLHLGVFSSNDRAIALYRSLGFVDDGVRSAHVKLPDGERALLLMSLSL